MSVLRTHEWSDEVPNLRRVDPDREIADPPLRRLILRRSGAGASRSPLGVFGRFRRARSREEAGWKQLPGAARRGTLERRKPRRASRLRLGRKAVRRPTDSHEVPDPVAGWRVEARSSGAHGTPARFAIGPAIDRAYSSDGWRRIADGKRGAGVERRYGFVWRGKLCRVKPQECHRHETRPDGQEGSKPSGG
jgi:hypothetical protein